MSSSQQPTSSPADPESPDEVMMEAPDSPPETSHIPLANQSASSVPANSQQSNSRHVNGESAKVNHGAPGSSWSTKKFQDEYDRSYSTLLDQNWDQAKYGDPLLQS